MDSAVGLVTKEKQVQSVVVNDNATNRSVTSQIELPKLMEWFMFHDTFPSLIHNNVE